MIAIPMSVSVTDVLVPVSVSTPEVSIPMSIGLSYQMTEGETYEGEYNFTPTQETQIIPTADKVLLDNITINPIPSNYGLITWNGSVLTVS